MRRFRADFLHGVLLVGQVLILLVPLAMGLLVSARGMRRPEVITAVVLRSGFGVLVGPGAGVVVRVSTGTAAAIALIGAAAPIGFTAVVLSAREGLDLDLAASAAAISVFLGIAVDPAGHDVRSTLSHAARRAD